MLGWMKHKLESRLTEEIFHRRNNLRYTEDTTLMAESEKELKSILMKVKEENEKAGLKGRGIQFHHFLENRKGSNGNSDRFYSVGLQNHCRW